MLLLLFKSLKVIEKGKQYVPQDGTHLKKAYYIQFFLIQLRLQKIKMSWVLEGSDTKTNYKKSVLL